MNHTTQVGIIGAGPAGLMLSLLLARQGIRSVILENRTRAYLEARVRAGLLEQNTVDLLRDLGLADRLDREGLTHHGVYLSFNGRRIRVPFDELTGGRGITIYGQQEVVKDLIQGHLAQNNTTGEPIQFEAVATQIKGLDTDAPAIHYQQNGELHTLHCDFVAGCDGYHGISRAALPTDSYREYRVEYPFSWLGILTRAVPASDELIYAYHERGFALLSLRSPTVSRLYIQVANDDKIENWSDEKIWDELDLRLSDGPGFRVNRGKIFEKSITPMRSFMIDNMQHGRLLLAGDAAHIVPPTGGKGLNLAVAEPWHTQRDSFSEFTNWLALVSGTLGKLGQDVLIMGQTEISEVVENATGGGKSSAMAHKNNPVLSEALVALARQNAQYAALQLQSLVHGNERDATAWLLEWENLPRMMITTATALNHAVSVTKTINVNMELG